MLKKFFVTVALAFTLLIVNGQNNQAEAWWGMVIDCNEWISLREYPSTEAYRLTTIPLHEWVWINGNASNGFYSAEYNGMRGYVLKAYIKYIKD